MAAKKSLLSVVEPEKKELDLVQVVVPRMALDAFWYSRRIFSRNVYDGDTLTLLDERQKCSFGSSIMIVVQDAGQNGLASTRRTFQTGRRGCFFTT
jgi:hypothetical protein